MIKGHVKDSKGLLLENVKIELKNNDFKTIISTKTDKDGYFEIEERKGFLPFLTAVKEYAENYLEFWATNIDLSVDRSLEIVIGTNEIYGANVFTVLGTYNPIFIYFRPMNLKKFKLGEKDIAPELNKSSVKIKVDNVKTNLLSLQKVKEHIDSEGKYLTAYLIQLERSNINWDKIEIKVIDQNDEVGLAKVFNNESRR